MYNRNPSLLVHCEIPKEMTDGEGRSTALDGEERRPGVDGEERRPGVDGDEGSKGLDGEEGNKRLDGEERRPGVDGEEGSTGLNDDKTIASGSKGLNSSDIRNAGLDYKELNQREKVCV